MIIRDWKKILEGVKTQESRLDKEDESWNEGNKGVYGLNPDGFEIPRYLVGETYAIKPARGKAAVMVDPDGHWTEPVNADDQKACAAKGYQPLRIRITGIRKADVRNFGSAALAEEGYGGFNALAKFLEDWTSRHDKAGHRVAFRPPPPHVPAVFDAQLDYLHKRPDKFYQAWVLSFRVVRKTGSKQVWVQVSKWHRDGSQEGVTLFTANEDELFSELVDLGMPEENARLTVSTFKAPPERKPGEVLHVQIAHDYPLDNEDYFHMVSLSYGKPPKMPRNRLLFD